jgi:hypothetical protein
MMAYLEEPFLSRRSLMAELIISEYLGWEEVCLFAVVAMVLT